VHSWRKQEMSRETFYNHYESLYNSLKVIIESSEMRVIGDEPDELFLDNINLFVKSYLILICTYLEAYLQDIAFAYVKELNSRLRSADIPHNFVHWRLVKDVKSKDLYFKNIDLSISKQDVSDNLSANPYKTIKLFEYLGIDLNSQEGFSGNKNIVNSIVTKRNNIIHHNDTAMDISFSDLKNYIDIFLIYIKSIDEAVDLSDID
jgi:RiboL-PSP-HEPN